MNKPLKFKEFFIENFNNFVYLFKESKATGAELMQNPETAKALYQSYYDTYAARGLSPWTKEDYDWRAKGWTFYGNLPGQVPEQNIGMITVKEKHGQIKMTGMQGPNIKAKIKGLIELKQDADSRSIPVWGAMDADFADRLQKLGFLRPPVTVMKQLMPIIKDDPSFAGGGNWEGNVGEDGGIDFNLSGVGVVRKYFVGSRLFFRNIIENKILKKHGVTSQQLQMAHSFGGDMFVKALSKKTGLDTEAIQWCLEVMGEEPAKLPKTVSTPGEVNPLTPSDKPSIPFNLSPKHFDMTKNIANSF